MKKAVIIGASSGIGFELAKILSSNDYVLALASRKVDKMKELQGLLPNESVVQYLDLLDHNSIEKNLESIVKKLKDIDLVVLSSGVGYLNEELKWNIEEETIDVNIIGTTKTINYFVNYFTAKGSGHIAAISSIASMKGSWIAPAYNASKAFLSNYLEGVRCRFIKMNLPVYVTDIKPGLVNTDMAKGEGLFWVMPVEKTSKQIFKAIRLKKKTAFVTKRWKLIAYILKIMPDWIYYKM
ncbi:MAG: SDR family NAD(P)-dependent oxidoreductase [Spirochaetes bacterium]|nr:SDR family NAD(P)-dependent oxidoreductase [Spirochaetota bacterium]